MTTTRERPTTKERQKTRVRFPTPTDDQIKRRTRWFAWIASLAFVGVVATAATFSATGIGDQTASAEPAYDYTMVHSVSDVSDILVSVP